MSKAQQNTTTASTSDACELEVGEDRGKLALYSVGLLLLMVVSILAAFLGFDFGYQGVSWAYLFTLVGLTVVWFSVGPFVRYFFKLVKNRGVMRFMPRELVIEVTGNPDKDLVVPYRDIKGAQIVRQGTATRLLLSGKWVEHPSGVYHVAISYPFRSEELDGVEGQVRDLLIKHKVKVS